MRLIEAALTYLFWLFAISFIAFCVWGATSAGATGVECWLSGHTGEGFPAITCADGRTYYADLDGDGLDATTNGRWVETSPAWIR